MVQIPQYEQQVGLDAPTRSGPQLDTNVDNSIGQGLASLGGAITNFSDVIQRRNRQKAEFNAKVGYDTLQEKLQQGLFEAEKGAPADGSGIHDNFMLSVRSKEVATYLDTVTDPEIRERYKTILDSSDAEHWSNQAANTEWKMGNKYSIDRTTEMWTKRGQSIAADPAAVKAYVDDMVENIDKAPDLTAAQREEMKQKIRESGPKIAAEALKQTDPEALYFASGRGTNEQRVGFLTRRLTPAVISAESGNDPRAVSPSGAVGLMQVMPDTAVEIAQKLGDKGFLSLSREQQIEALKNPETSKRYGTTYLGMMVDKYGGDVEAALIAYNAGPGNADKWLEAGRDYSALPKASETQPYVQKVLGAMGPASLASGPADRGPAVGNGKRIPILTGTQNGRQSLNMNGVSDTVVSTWEQVQGDFGRALPVVSGFRDPGTNAKAGGAKHSQHMEGSALDIDVSSLSKEERVKLVKLASARGFTGIGIYKNSIHVDMRKGAPVVWGSTHHAASVPAWAFHVAAQHREGAYRTGAPVQLADASGTGGLTANDAGPQFIVADGVPGSSPPGVGSGEARSGFVSPAFSDLPAGDLLDIQGTSTTAWTKAQQAQLAQQTADEILSMAGATEDKAGDSKAAYSALDAITDAEVRKDVATLVDSHFTRWTRVEKDQQEQLVKDTTAAVDGLVGQGDTKAAYDTLKKANLPAEDYNRLMTRISRGPVEFDDPRATVEAAALKSQPEVFAGTDLVKKYGNNLTAETVAKLLEDQATVKKTLAGEGDDASRLAIETTKTANPIIESNLKAIGIDTSAKATPADVQHANLVRAMTMQEIEARQAKNNGKPLLLTEITDSVNAVMKTYPRFKPVEGSWIGNTTGGMIGSATDTDVSMPEVLQAFDNAKLDINQAAAALRKVGKPVNPATLQDALEALQAVPK
jgi:hypothetical protein